MNKNIFITQQKSSEQIKLNMVIKIIKMYNSTLYKYTKEFRGRLATPKSDTSKIPKKFISISEYLNSKSEWRNILNFTKEINDVIISNYIDVMIKNWGDIALYLNLKTTKPLCNVIFSPKLRFLYDKFLENEKINKEINKHLVLDNDEDFNTLIPSLRSNINSLFKLKKLNSNMSYKDIVSIFIGEFEDVFIDKVKELDEDDITKENLYKIFK